MQQSRSGAVRMKVAARLGMGPKPQSVLSKPVERRMRAHVRKEDANHVEKNERIIVTNQAIELAKVAPGGNAGPAFLVLVKGLPEFVENLHGTPDRGILAAVA